MISSTVQRPYREGLDRLECWLITNCMKFTEEECWILSLGQCNPGSVPLDLGTRDSCTALQTGNWEFWSIESSIWVKSVPWQSTIWQPMISWGALSPVQLADVEKWLSLYTQHYCSLTLSTVCSLWFHYVRRTD